MYLSPKFHTLLLVKNAIIHITLVLQKRSLRVRNIHIFQKARFIDFWKLNPLTNN